MRFPVNLDTFPIQTPVLMRAVWHLRGAVILLVQLQEWQGIKQVPVSYHRNYDENDAIRMKQTYKIIKQMACTETSQVVYSLVKGKGKGLIFLFGVWLYQSQLELLTTHLFNL